MKPITFDAEIWKNNNSLLVTIPCLTARIGGLVPGTIVRVSMERTEKRISKRRSHD